MNSAGRHCNSSFSESLGVVGVNFVESLVIGATSPRCSSRWKGYQLRPMKLSMDGLRSQGSIQSQWRSPKIPSVFARRCFFYIAPAIAMLRPHLHEVRCARSQRTSLFLSPFTRGQSKTHKRGSKSAAGGAFPRGDVHHRNKRRPHLEKGGWANTKINRDDVLRVQRRLMAFSPLRRLFLRTLADLKLVVVEPRSPLQFRCAQPVLRATSVRQGVWRRPGSRRT